MGNKTSQTLTDPGAGGPAGWWPLTQTSGTTVRGLRSRREPGDRLGGHLDRRRGELHRAGRAGDHHPRPGGGHHRVVQRVRVGEPGRVHRQRPGGGLPGRGRGVRVLPRDRQRPPANWEFARPLTDNDQPAWRRRRDSGAHGPDRHLDAPDRRLRREHRRVSSCTSTAPTGGDATDTDAHRGHGPLEIGARQVERRRRASGFDGTIANVQVYPTALSAAEVASLYEQAAGGDLTPGDLTTSYQVDQLGQVTAETNPDGTPPATPTTRRASRPDHRAAGGRPGRRRHPGDGAAGHHDRLQHVRRGRRGAGPEREHHHLRLRRRRAAGVPGAAALHPARRHRPVSGARTAYNTLGQVTPQTDPLGNITRYAYDQLGHRTGRPTRTTASPPRPTTRPARRCR